MTSNAPYTDPEDALRAVESAQELNDLLYLHQLAIGEMEKASDPSCWWRVAYAAARSAGLENEAMSATLLLWNLGTAIPSDAPDVTEIIQWALAAAHGRSIDELRPGLRDSLVLTQSIDELRVWRRLKNRLALLQRLPDAELTEEARRWLEKWAWIP